MAKVRYEADLYYSFKPDEKTTVVKGFLVSGFSVWNSPTGNQNNLNSTNEIDIEFKLRETVTYKNISFWLLPTQGLEAVEIGGFFHYREKLNIQFRVEVYSGKIMTKSFTLEGAGAELIDYPRAAKDTIIVSMVLPSAKVETVSAKVKIK